MITDTSKGAFGTSWSNVLSVSSEFTACIKLSELRCKLKHTLSSIWEHLLGAFRSSGTYLRQRLPTAYGRSDHRTRRQGRENGHCSREASKRKPAASPLLERVSHSLARARAHLHHPSIPRHPQGGSGLRSSDHPLPSRDHVGTIDASDASQMGQGFGRDRCKLNSYSSAMQLPQNPRSRGPICCRL